MLNFLEDGRYHTYLENDFSILDIVANSFYSSKEDAKDILCGDIIKKMTYYEIEEAYTRIKKYLKLVIWVERSYICWHYIMIIRIGSRYIISILFSFYVIIFLVL